MAQYDTYANPNAAQRSAFPYIALTVDVKGECLYLAAHLSAAVPANLLRVRVGSLKQEAGVLLDALDAVISGV